MKKTSFGFAHIGILLAIIVTLIVFLVGRNLGKLNFASKNSALADFEIPKDKPEKGLVYKGLGKDLNGPCKKGFFYTTDSGKIHCTHGPDESPDVFDVTKSVPPNSNSGVATNTVTCDGDGQSGKRFLAIYAHAADVTSRYDEYKWSFQNWVSGVDDIFKLSSIRSGGTSVAPRFVHDASCVPQIDNVTLTATGDNDFSSMENELRVQGYNNANRKYLVFVDTAVYCGIGDIGVDDKLASTNWNNQPEASAYSYYARVDNGCWSDVIPAHELMHTIGAVQLSAPHSSGGFHCTDIYDRMCYSDSPYYPAMVITCTDPAQSRLYDCNHDDYFSTNVTSSASYLYGHWNAASSNFLIGAYPLKVIYVDNLSSYKLVNGSLVPTTSFSVSDKNIVVRVHTKDPDQSLVGTDLRVELSNNKGIRISQVTGVTGADGWFQGNLSLPSKQQPASSTIKVTSATYQTLDMATNSLTTLLVTLKK